MSDQTKQEKVRAFVAIYGDPATTAELQHVQQMLAREIPAGIRWTRPEQLHLTLQFLGNVHLDLLPEIERVAANACHNHHPFEMRAEGLGCFPGERKPRILWAGISGALEALRPLKAELDTALAAVGYIPEERDFHPHITLGRVEHLKVRDIEQLSRLKVCYDGVCFGRWRAEKVDLMQSTLGAGGAKYTLLRSFPLKF